MPLLRNLTGQAHLHYDYDYYYDTQFPPFLDSVSVSGICASISGSS